jgi:hypothetical protein
MFFSGIARIGKRRPVEAAVLQLYLFIKKWMHSPQ